MSIWTGWRDLLPGLMPAAFRGVRFHVINSRHEVGRRILLTWMPGIDTPASDDFGLLPGMIDVRALVVGDDYVAQAEAFRRACETPGIGTLLHPWLGEKRVLIERPAQISLADNELGVAWIDVGFTPVEVSLAPLVDTASQVLSAAGALRTAAGGYGSAALGGITTVATRAQVHETARAVAGTISSRISMAPEGAALMPLLQTGIQQIGSVVSGAT